ncbi:hypothetical protein A8F94_08460 [Bacillus sp. FJAT-27225]|uniref:hypothetical protein n=1 Tax=Bacillus sp. FJAT-27225 TaxID=1743144 RepID=UPI00080C2A4B|nr:hypothetical protein [Bacillus sp. FJAT-27225]OCA87861.1 hypothetical protein A8F94_08460 [Bacillus sp. FJAT-27225]
MAKFSSKEIFQKLTDIEERYNLFSYEVNGIKVWEVMRFEVFRTAITSAGLQGQPHNIFSQNVKAHVRLFRYLKILYWSFSKNPFMGNYTKEILVFDSPRKVLINGQFQDRFTNDLLESFNETNYEVLERHFLGQHLGTNKKNRKYLDIFKLYEMIFERKYNTILHHSVDFLDKAEEAIKEEIGIGMNLKEICCKKIRTFMIYFTLYDKLFRKRRPKKIYLLVSYSNHPLIAAAKANNIQVIELQHGVISRYNPAYTFPYSKQKLEYFPDLLYVFGQYWKASADYPIPLSNIKVTGYPFLGSQMEELKGTPKKKYQILFLSQGTIGHELSVYAHQLAKILPDYEIVYKLHPGEYGRWQNYDYLVKAKELKNFSLIEEDNDPLHILLAESEFQVGVSSFAIFEGLAYNCKTILMDLSGIEHMEFLLDNQLVMLASNSTELADRIENFQAKVMNKSFFFQNIIDNE